MHVFGPLANCKCERTLMANVIAFTDTGYVVFAVWFYFVMVLCAIHDPRINSICSRLIVAPIVK